MPITTESTYAERPKRNAITSWIDPSIIVRVDPDTIRKRNGIRTTTERKHLDTMLALRAERINTMPITTNTHFGQGRGRKPQDVTLTSDTVAYFVADLDNVRNGTYIALLEGDFEGPVTKVGAAILEALSSDLGDAPEGKVWTSSTRTGKAVQTEGGKVEVSIHLANPDDVEAAESADDDDDTETEAE